MSIEFDYNPAGFLIWSVFWLLCAVLLGAMFYFPREASVPALNKEGSKRFGIVVGSVCILAGAAIAGYNNIHEFSRIRLVKGQIVLTYPHSFYETRLDPSQIRDVKIYLRGRTSVSGCYLALRLPDEHLKSARLSCEQSADYYKRMDDLLAGAIAEQK